MLAIVITLAAIASLLWFFRNGVQLPLPFRDRSCQGTEWHRAFPSAAKQDIRQFLSVFVEAFAFRDTERLKFNPNDQLIVIYRSLYPHKWMPDALELETLAKAIHSKYGIQFANVWNERLTLGELFAHIQDPPQTRV